MRCLLCPMELRELADEGRDLCAGCEWLIKGDRLMRDHYRLIGGNFTGLTLIAEAWKWKHGTVAGAKRHGCECEPCQTALAESRARTRAGRAA